MGARLKIHLTLTNGTALSFDSASELFILHATRDIAIREADDFVYLKTNEVKEMTVKLDEV